MGIFFLQKNISKNLEFKNNAVNNTWKAFNDKLTERDIILNSQSSLNSDTLKYLLNKSKSERLNKNNSLNIVFDEYLLNKIMMQHLAESDKTFVELNSNLNILKTNYNSVVKDYNVYFSIFPNFIIAKKRKFKKAYYFNIEYGKENEDPIKKSKELPEWAKNADTIN